MDILKNGNNYNYFKIDIFLYKYLHDLQNNKFNIIKDIIDNGIENGLIYHIEQLKNLFPDSNIFCDNNEIFIKNNLSSELKLFVKKEIYNKDFYFFINNFIQEIDNCLIDSDLLLLVFVGNKDVGEILLNKIKNYSNNEDFALGICFRNKEIHNQLIEYIKNNFLNYAVFITNEFGNDIIPTLIMYKHIIKKINFTYIIKLHTKSEIIWFNELVDFLFNLNLKELRMILKSEIDSNCLGNSNYKYYIDNKNNFEYFVNKKLKDKYKGKMDKKYFIAGTIFFCEKITFDTILDFIENNNFRCYFTNNFYDSNIINFTNSPLHFIERLFGTIKLN